MKPPEAPEDALKTAIARAGGLTAVGKLFNISPQAVNQWTTCPPTRVLAVETASGVPRYELRPDLYPPPQKA